MALAFATGIAGAPWIRASLAWPAWIGAVLLAALGAWRWPAWAAAPLLVGVAALGALRGLAPPVADDDVSRLDFPVTARVEGRLATEPIRWAPDRTRLLIDVERAGDRRLTGRVQATLHGEPPALTEGQRVAAELRLREPRGFRNPGVFDYAEHLAREGIGALATGRAEALAPLDDPGPPWPVRVKRFARGAMHGVLPPASAALLGGLLLGDRSELPREIDDGFRRAGVYHVLAVSGFNVALLASTVFACLTLAGAGRRAAAATALAAVVAFALVVGLEPSVLRAAIMGVLVLAAVILDREASLLNSLALAAVVILAARPGDLRDPGFQLSFAATLGLVLAPLPRGLLAGALGASAAAQLAVLPITLAHFNQLSIIGVVANLAVVPLAGIATVVGLAGLTLSALSGAAGAVLLDAVWPVLITMRAVVAAAAAVPGAVVHLPAPPAPAIAAYAAALGAALTARRLRTDRPAVARVALAAALSLLAAAVALAAWPLVRPADGRLRVTVLDVGQGDAIVVETPDGRALVIDAGPGGPRRLDAGERVVAPFLWNRGHLRLAAALATHPDLDHAGGMPAVRRLFGSPEPCAGERPDGQRWYGGLLVSAVTSPAPLAGARVSRNDAGLVVRLELGLASILLASDITARAEQELLASGTPLAATVLKVAHHGARGSSTPEFLAAVRPAVAVVSVGARNAYGQPSPATLDRLAAVAAVTYRTDRDGAVLLETDGRVLTVTRWAARRTERYCLDPESIC